MKKLLKLLLLLFLPGFTISGGDDARTVLLDNISAHLEREIVTHKKDCISITVLKNDSIVYYNGVWQISKKERATPDTSAIFRIGSVTKSFTAVLMLKLAEEGYFKLDDPVENYLPEIKDIQGYTSSTKITFRQLATHTAGLDREANNAGLLYCTTSQWESKILQAIPQTKFALKPNTGMLYSNIGYNILGLALSRAAQDSYMKLVTDKIFIPLGMTSSYFEIPDEKKDKLIASTGTKGTEHTYMAWRVASSGIYTTAIDMCKFAAMLMESPGKKILTDKSLAILKQISSQNMGSYNGYAMGLMVYTGDNEKRIYGHNGATHGYRACYAFDYVRKNAVVIFVNNDTEYKLWGECLNILKDLAGLKKE